MALYSGRMLLRKIDMQWRVRTAPKVLALEGELRQVFEAEDFGAEFTPELREQEARIRSQIDQQKS